MTRMSRKKQRCSSILESLHHDVVEHILERLDVDSLMRFKGASKQWKTTIESLYFQRRQLTHRHRHRQQSGNPDVLMVSLFPDDDDDDDDIVYPVIQSLRRLVLGSSSSSSSSVNIPTPWETGNTRFFVSYNSCDGLVCLYNYRKPGFVVNPTTRWYRPLPLSKLQQQHMFDLGRSFYDLDYVVPSLGFGKDKITGTYKPVWLYNSSEIGLDNATTTCEVFDFSTNAWRSVSPAAPYRIVAYPEPVCVDGSLHWFTECEETEILSLDLHTEAFQVICKAPFVANVNEFDIVMCDLDNRLCVSERKWPNQVIWSFNSANKTWHKMFSIDLATSSSQWFGTQICALLPLALFDGKKKLLFYCRELRETLVELDLETKTYDLVFRDFSTIHPVCYFQSLISIS